MAPRVSAAKPAREGELESLAEVLSILLVFHVKTNQGVDCDGMWCVVQRKGLSWCEVRDHLVYLFFCPVLRFSNLKPFVIWCHLYIMGSLVSIDGCVSNGKRKRKKSAR
jgi:hypothetical protein